MFDAISKLEIEDSLARESRQYLAGNLTRPQKLKHVHTSDLEIGISAYSEHRAEDPHFHTEATEFQYVLNGWTRYLDLDTGEEYNFTKGDFYVIHPKTKYAQKSKAGTAILFIKIPSINDKQSVELTEEVQVWMKDFLRSRRKDYSGVANAPVANSIKPAASVALCHEGQVLMVQRADSGYWTLPGGTLDIGESLPSCAVREMQEETGLRVEITDVLGTYTDPDIKIEYSDGEVRQEFTIVFLAKSEDSRVVIDHESLAYAWVPLSSVLSVEMADSQRKRIEDLLKFLATGKKRIA